MGEPFDPYLRWLGIRDQERPPNHYRLLGVDLFEADLDVIAMAADRQMTHLRTLQTGAHAELSQRILNELSAARVCLLKPEKKASYDEQLRRRLAASATAAATRQLNAATVAAPAAPVEAAPVPATSSSIFADLSDIDSFRGQSTGRKRSAASSSSRGKFKLWPWIAAAGASAALAVCVALWRADAGGESTDNPLSNNRADVAQSSNHGVNASPNERKVGSDAKKSGDDSSRDPKQQPANHGPAAKAPTFTPHSTSPEAHPAVVSHLDIPSGVEAPNSSGPTISSPRTVKDNVTLAPSVAQPRSSIETQPVAIVPAAEIAPPPGKAVTKGSNQNVGPPDSRIATKVSPVDRGQKPKPGRAPIPSKEAQATAEQVILGIYKIDLDQANHGTAAMKIALAKKIQQQAIDTPDDPAARYLLFLRAQELAASGSDGPLAFSIADKLADRFAVDGAEEKFNVLLSLQKNARSPEAGQALVPLANEAIDRAVAADKYEVAGKIVRMASGWAVKLHSPQLATQEKARASEIEQMKREYGKSVDALAILEKRPDDPEANFAVGYFQGPIKGDFANALPKLVKGSEPTFRELAGKELTEPTDVSAQVALADGWWNVAEDKREPAKGNLHWHAAQWYKLALPELKGLNVAQAETRIKQAKTEHPMSVAPDQIEITRILTSGDWHITWYGPRTNYTGSKWFEYPHLKFSRDGTFQDEDGTGNWVFDEDGTTVILKYDTSKKTQWVQRYHLVDDGLRCEHFDPPTVLASIGLGVKNHLPLAK